MIRIKEVKLHWINQIFSVPIPFHPSVYFVQKDVTCEGMGKGGGILKNWIGYSSG